MTKAFSREAVLAFLFLTGMSGAAMADPIAMDTPVAINGVDTACTGIADSKDDPRWQTYPVRIEFSNGASQYIAGAHVSLAKGGAVIAELDCQAPWVLFKVSPGSYSVTASMLGSSAKPRTAKFLAPSTGQKRVVLQFTDFQANQ